MPSPRRSRAVAALGLTLLLAACGDAPSRDPGIQISTSGESQH
jgi:hypothetical protein